MLNFDPTTIEKDDTTTNTTTEQDVKKPLNNGDYGDLESFRVIFIPNDNTIQPYEIEISIKDKSIESQFQEILKSKITVSVHITNKDTSFVIFPNVDLTGGREGKQYNVRASQLFRKKELIGDAIFASHNGSIYRDISLEQFVKLEQYVSKKMAIFDFESCLRSQPDYDLVKVLTIQSKFQIDRDIWIYEKKTAPQFLNEYTISQTGDSKNVFKPTVIDLKPHGPFVAHETHDGINFYSKLSAQKAMAINGLGIRVLRYFIHRQNSMLFGGEMYIDTSEAEYLVELAAFNKDQEDYRLKQEAEALKNGTTLPSKQQTNTITTATSTTTTTTATTSTATTSTYNLSTDVEFREYEPSPRIDVEFKEEPKEVAGETIEYIELYGYKIKKNHEIIGIKEKEIYKHVIKKGSKPLFPTIGNQITITYVSMLPSGKVIHEKSKLNVTIGETDCLIGIHYALTFMNPGEISIVVLDPKYAYGELGLPGLIPPHTPVVCHIEVSGNNIDVKSKRTPGAMITMSVSDKIAAIRKGSDLAKNNYNRKSMGRALRDYKNLVDYYHLDYMSKTTEKEWEQLQQLASTNYVNIAICYSKMNRWDRTLTNCKEALEFDDECPKTHYWISKCYKQGQNYEDAITELELAQKYDAQSTTPRLSPDQYQKELVTLRELLSLQEIDQRKMYKRVFEKLPTLSSQEIEKQDDLLFDQDNNDDNDESKEIKIGDSTVSESDFK